MSWILKSNRPYIKEDQKALVRAHKYQGQELSYSYNYFYSPVCNWVADRLPMWLAPNLVSLMGFLFNLVPHLMIPILFTSDMEGDIPRWFCVFMGICFFGYMICDNTDGKQARRTGSSSPLGMLIDHGMDSITAVINNMMISVMVQIGNNMISIVGMVASTLPFYYAVLEQYYTGELILQSINGIDEGSFVYIFVCFLAGYLGPKELFTQTLQIGGSDVQIGHILGYLLIFSTIPQIIPNFVNMYQKRHNAQFKKLYRREYFISHMLWYFINAALFFTAAYISPQGIVATHPRRVQYAFGLQFILIALRVQYSGVTLDIFSPFRRTSIIVWSLLISQIFFTVYYKTSMMDEAMLYLIICVITFAAILHMISFLIQEFTQILDINVLTLTRRQLEAQKSTTKRD